MNVQTLNGLWIISLKTFDNEKNCVPVGILQAESLQIKHKDRLLHRWRAQKACILQGKNQELLHRFERLRIRKMARHMNKVNRHLVLVCASLNV